MRMRLAVVWSCLFALAVGGGYLAAGGKIQGVPVVIAGALIAASAVAWAASRGLKGDVVGPQGSAVSAPARAQRAIRRTAAVYGLILVIGGVAATALSDGVPVFALLLLGWPGVLLVVLWIMARRTGGEPPQA
jgi:hypothetical protein